VSTLESKLCQKAEQNDVELINERLEEMPNRKEVAQVRVDLFENMDKFIKQNAEFKSQLKK